MYSLTIVLSLDEDAGEGASPRVLVSVSSTERPGGCPFQDAIGHAEVDPAPVAWPAVSAGVTLHLSQHTDLTEADREKLRAIVAIAMTVLR